MENMSSAMSVAMSLMQVSSRIGGSAATILFAYDSSKSLDFPASVLLLRFLYLFDKTDASTFFVKQNMWSDGRNECKNVMTSRGDIWSDLHA